MDKIQRISGNLFYLTFLFLFFWLSFFSFPAYEDYWKIILGILIFILIISFYARKGNLKDFFSTNGEIFLWLYVIVSLLGVFGVKDKNIALNYYFMFIVPAPILYFLFKNEFVLIKNKSHFFLFICICALIVALIGIAEFITKKNIIYSHIIHNIFFECFNREGRIMSTQFIPQVLGTYLAGCLPFTFYFIFKSKGLFTRIICVICSALIVVAIIATFTRGVFLAVFFSSLLYAFFKNKKMLLIIFLISLILVLIFTFASVSFTGSSLKRLSFGSLTKGGIARFDRFWAAILMAKDHPFKGVGLGNYKLFFDTYDYNQRLAFVFYDKNADNMFLTILAESGIFTVIFFIFFLFYLFKKCYNHIKLKELNSEIILSLATAILAILFSSVFTLDALYWPSPLYMFWMFCGMLTSITDKQKNA
jgi:O-antigen ligase